jgi:hypothetical protein
LKPVASTNSKKSCKEGIVQRATLTCLALLVAGMTMAVGCGGGGDDSPTKAEFVKQADAICQKGDDKRTSGLQSKEQYISNAPTRKAMRFRQKVLYRTVVVPSMQQEAEELAALTPPSGEEEEVEAVLGAFDRAIAGAEKGPGEPDQQAFEDFNEAAEGFGLKTCTI